MISEEYSFDHLKDYLYTNTDLLISGEPTGEERSVFFADIWKTKSKDILYLHLFKNEKVRFRFIQNNTTICGDCIDLCVGLPRLLKELDVSSKNVLLEDYGSTWYIPRVEQGFDTKDIRYDVIKMTNLGLINPIEFVHKNNKIAIDGYAMYTIIDGIPTMIGKWEETSFEIYDHDSSLDALINKAMTALPFISAHRKYISPYLVSNTTVVNV